jgi:hypothetical protein
VGGCQSFDIVNAGSKYRPNPKPSRFFYFANAIGFPQRVLFIMPNNPVQQTLPILHASGVSKRLNCEISSLQIKGQSVAAKVMGRFVPVQDNQDTNTNLSTGLNLNANKVAVGRSDGDAGQNSPALSDAFPFVSTQTNMNPAEIVHLHHRRCTPVPVLRTRERLLLGQGITKKVKPIFLHIQPLF